MRHELTSSRFWTVPAVIGLIGLLAACAAPVMLPSAQMTNARASIAQAESAGATQRAPVELLAARDKLGKAEVAARAENFMLAERLSDEARADAELAERKSRAVKAQAAADELAQSNDLLRKELERKSMR